MAMWQPHLPTIQRSAVRCTCAEVCRSLLQLPGPVFRRWSARQSDGFVLASSLSSSDNSEGSSPCYCRHDQSSDRRGSRFSAPNRGRSQRRATRCKPIFLVRRNPYLRYPRTACACLPRSHEGGCQTGRGVSSWPSSLRLDGTRKSAFSQTGGLRQLPRAQHRNRTCRAKERRRAGRCQLVSVPSNVGSVARSNRSIEGF